jgi:uncharacterized membrane protein YhaH (DUF805 family)
MKWYLMALKKYADFSGRARRKEYWMFTLFQLIFAITCMILDNVFGTTLGILHYGVIYLFFLGITILPTFAVAVRRLHDINKSGWTYLMVLIPLVGPILMLIYFCTEGDAGTNGFGSDPKQAEPVS